MLWEGAIRKFNSSGMGVGAPSTPPLKYAHPELTKEAAKMFRFSTQKLEWVDGSFTESEDANAKLYGDHAWNSEILGMYGDELI